MFQDLTKRREADDHEKFEIDFHLKNDLIYHLKNDKKRLCISSFCETDVFKLAHDQNNHFDHHHVYNKLIDHVYILKLFRKIRLYIKHCSVCELNQTKKHLIYEELLSISSEQISFKIIAMNFILTLSEEINTALIVICKASKRVLIISTKFT
jgi:hypothetical protein